MIQSANVGLATRLDWSVMRGWKALVFLAGWGACYSAPTGDERCTITCVDDCPGDLTCQNGFCVGDGEESSHAVVAFKRIMPWFNLSATRSSWPL